MTDFRCYRCQDWPCECADGCAVIHGDSRQVFASIAIPPGAVIVTDPPYGIAHKSHGQWFKTAEPIAGDGDESLGEWLLELCGEAIPLVMFFSPDRPPRTKWRSVLVWSKGGHTGGGGDPGTTWKRDFELVGVRNNGRLSGGRDSAVLSFNALSPPPSGHFCEKPVGLLKYLITKIGGGVVIDPFAGSGSTVRAAKDVGRRAIGVELDERWVECCCRRLEQGGLFQCQD